MCINDDISVTCAQDSSHLRHPPLPCAHAQRCAQHARRMCTSPTRCLAVQTLHLHIGMILDLLMKQASALVCSWSYIGRDILKSKLAPQNEPTMNLGWDITRDRDAALHEIGHTLACEHEHQNPNSGAQRALVTYTFELVACTPCIALAPRLDRALIAQNWVEVHTMLQSMRCMCTSSCICSCAVAE